MIDSCPAYEKEDSQETFEEKTDKQKQDQIMKFIWWNFLTGKCEAHKKINASIFSNRRLSQTREWSTITKSHWRCDVLIFIISKSLWWRHLAHWPQLGEVPVHLPTRKRVCMYRARLMINAITTETNTEVKPKYSHEKTIILVYQWSPHDWTCDYTAYTCPNIEINKLFP